MYYREVSPTDKAYLGQEVVRRLNLGLPLSAIARQAGKTPSQLRYILRRYHLGLLAHWEERNALYREKTRADQEIKRREYIAATRVRKTPTEVSAIRRANALAQHARKGGSR